MNLRWIGSAVAALIFVASCDNGADPVVRDNTSDVIVVDRKASLPYRIEPTAPDVLTLSFYNSVDHRALRSARLLGPDGDTLATVTLTVPDVPYSSTFTGAFNYAFDPALSYSFAVESEVLRDSVFLYGTEIYRHVFKSSFTYEKLTDLSSFYGYDLDPLRKTLFIVDNELGGAQRGFVLKKISLSDFTVSTIAPIPVAFKLVRALSDHELLTYTGTWAGRFLKGDSAALIRVDLNTGLQRFVDWTSASYGRASRIVNGHILYMNPYFSPGTSTLLNLASGERQLFTYGQLNPFSIRDNFDNLYAGETIYDFSTGLFVDELHIKDPSSILYMDDQTSCTFVIDNLHQTATDYPQHRLLGRLSVYKGTAISVRQEYEDHAYPILGRIIRVKDDKVIYYKQTSLAFKPPVAGYYALNLQTGQSELLHCDYMNGANDLMLDDNTMLSIRAGGVYKITMP